MQHLMRNAVAAALTAVAALGLAAPAASAAGHQAEGHVHHAENAPHGHGFGHGVKLGKHDAAQQRQLVRDITRLDARLAWLTRDSRLAGLADDQRAAVEANAAADRAALSAFKDSVLAAGSSQDLRSARVSLRLVRPEVYNVALADLRRASRLQATVDQNAVDLAAVTDRDVTAGVTAEEQASAALADAVAKALALTANSPNADLRAIDADFATVNQALETVEGVLSGADDSAGTTEPTDPTDSGDPVDGGDATNPDA